MLGWRVTKYNPNSRDETGKYINNEWTSFGDIGKSFNSIEFTIDDYKLVEDAYVNAVLLFMSIHNISTMNIIGLEKHSDTLEIKQFQDVYPTEITDFYSKLKRCDVLGLKEIELLCKLVLREHLWCKLDYCGTMFVHFGYDFYMYIGGLIKSDSAIESIIKSGLFVESFESPYND